MIYKAHLKQGGEGCGFMIGCGETVIDIKGVDNIQDAEQKLIEIIIEQYGGDSKIASATLYEVSDVVNIHVGGIYRNQDDKVLREIMREKEVEDRMQYEQLKKRFEQSK